MSNVYGRARAKALKIDENRDKDISKEIEKDDSKDTSKDNIKVKENSTVFKVGDDALIVKKKPKKRLFNFKIDEDAYDRLITMAEISGYTLTEIAEKTILGMLNENNIVADEDIVAKYKKKQAEIAQLRAENREKKKKNKK